MSDRTADNTRLFITVVMMVVVAAMAIFVISVTVGRNERIAKINRDGISCILEQLNEHRQNSFTAAEQSAAAHQQKLYAPAPAPQPVPRELIAACDRFIESP